jgi:PEP-CTERM motif
MDNLSAVPEPTTAAMLVGAVSLLALRRRRK